MQLEGYEFNSFTSKKGKTMLIGDLQRYIEDKQAEGRFAENQAHFITECPYCKSAYLKDKSYDGPYEKYKLYVKKDYSTGWCFRCDQGFINLSEETSLKVSTPEPPVSLQDFSLVTLPKYGNGWTLERFNDFDLSDSQGLNYLIYKRHAYLEKLYRPLKVRFFDHNPVIPFYYKGDLIYYQIKFAFGNHKIKYFSPPIKHKPPYIIEHGNNKKFIICEGTFDAISLLIQAPTYTPMALLGSSITDYQLTMLRTYMPEKVIVYMDETELSKKVANRIRAYLNYADVDLIKSGGMDPEEMLKKRMAEGQLIQWVK